MYAGKSLNNKDQSASIKGAIAFAMHARLMAEQYGVVAIVHSDHCAYVNVSSFQCDATFFFPFFLSLLPLHHRLRIAVPFTLGLLFLW